MRQHATDLLDLVGLVLISIAVGVAFFDLRLAGALASTAVCLLLSSFLVDLTTPKRKART